MMDKFLKFPGRKADDKPKTDESNPFAQIPPGMQPTPEQMTMAQQMLQSLSPDQQKAMQIVMSGMPFVCIGIQATDRGADFFTALHGEPADLRNAQPHLDGVISRAYSRKGV